MQVTIWRIPKDPFVPIPSSYESGIVPSQIYGNHKPRHASRLDSTCHFDSKNLPAACYLVLDWCGTKWPTNVDDTSSTGSDRLTDIALVALKYELLIFAADCIGKLRQQEMMSSSEFHLHSLGKDTVEDALNALKDAEELIETKYLRYCNPSQPLHLITMLTARYALNIS